MDVAIPVYLPIGNTAAELEAYRDNLFGKISYAITKAHAGEKKSRF